MRVVKLEQGLHDGVWRVGELPDQWAARNGFITVIRPTPKPVELPGKYGRLATHFLTGVTSLHRRVGRLQRLQSSLQRLHHIRVRVLDVGQGEDALVRGASLLLEHLFSTARSHVEYL